MTLFKQIMIAVIAFGIVIFMAVGYLNFKSLNGYINDQLGENARHTANSLGLALKPIVDPEDMSLAQTMINSMFDSGRYKLIKLEDVDGKVLIENSQQTIVKDIPEWFYKIAKFEAPVATSEIMTGWAKFGTLYVQGSTALAYNELYSNSKNIFNFLALMIIIALVVAFFALKAIFRPLVKVQDQAEAILDNKFIIQKRIPFTTDLKKMVLAMNSMVSKVQDIFEREAATLSKYQELLYKDSMSGTYNRRFFQTKFSEYLASEEYSSGVASLVSFKDLAGLKGVLGFEKWQSVIIKIAQILQEKSTENDQNAIVARLNDNDFILLSYGKNSSNFSALDDKIMAEFKKLYANFSINDSECPVNAAIVEYSPSTDMRTLLTSADVTLASARLAGCFTCKEFNANQNTLVIGKEKYKELIFDSIKEDKFKFAAQKVVGFDSNFEQYELYLRLVDSEGKWRMASYFMPMVNELNLGAMLDLHILNRIARILPENILPQGSLAINLGKEILSSDENFSKLEATLKKIAQISKYKNYIEIPNKDDISIESIVRLTKKLKELGFGFGFDHFELSAKGIEKLKEFNPDYVKIQSSVLIDFLSDKSGANTKQSLDVVLSSKDIILIAIGVESEEQKSKLIELGIKNMQGIYIDEIKNIG
ncbi:bifunctional diguanylate cyclase/phosphodiesterase [Campylobacter concisus]|uniref:bifunctional diguanylate cyclase/phosphodiesterase n=1 Tax=Campylobacter concisus TaxID=199 RepID=UPI00122D1F1F|nr:LapD/MoxY N-terminal periplasmic domain-containing protein [Campylobacter concisus]